MTLMKTLLLTAAILCLLPAVAEACSNDLDCESACIYACWINCGGTANCQGSGSKCVAGSCTCEANCSIFGGGRLGDGCLGDFQCGEWCCSPITWECGGCFPVAQQLRLFSEPQDLLAQLGAQPQPGGC